MDFLEQVSLAPLTTLGIGGPARYFAEARSQEDVREAIAFAEEKDLPLFVLGGGSNLVIADEGFGGLVLKVSIRGVNESAVGDKRVFTAGAGEDWDAFVAVTVERGCAGLECLSGIPGTVGGTPVQNVGAYGQDVSETISEVSAINRFTGEACTFSSEDCQFSYRTSVFNKTEKGHWIIVSVSFALTPGGRPKVEYADLRRCFGEQTPTLSQVRAAVREIRKSKAMLLVEGDEDARSAGSFFKNPIVSSADYERISSTSASAVPKFAAGDGVVKIPAAWLVEQAGFSKGTSRGPVGISRKHALAIVNRGGAKAADVIALKNEIQDAVEAKFGIRLRPEPVFVGFRD